METLADQGRIPNLSSVLGQGPADSAPMAGTVHRLGMIVPDRRSVGGLLLVVAKLLPLPLTAGSTAILARALSTAEFGQFATGVALAWLLNSFSFLGLDQSYLRGTISARQFNRLLLLWNGVYVLMAVGLAACLDLAGLDGVATALMATALLNFGSAMTALPLLVPQFKMRFGARAWREALQRSLVAIGPVVGLIWSPTLLGASLGSAVVGLVLVACGVAYWHSADRARFGDVRSPLKVFAVALPLGLTSGLFVGTRQLFTVIAGLVGGVLVAADTRVLMSILLILTAIPATVSNDIYRVKLFRSADSHLEAMLLRVNAGVGLGLAVTWIAASPFIIPLVFGSTYSDLSRYSWLVALAATLFALNSSLDTILIARNRVWQVVRRLGVGAVVAITGTACLAANGVGGVMTAVLLTEVAGVLLAGFALWPVQRNRKALRSRGADSGGEAT